MRPETNLKHSPNKGIYILILRLNNEKDLEIGRLGTFHFGSGYYYYTGSARGTGGWKRVIRHFSICSGSNKTRRWHIDYLLPYSEIVCAILLPTDKDIECSVAEALLQISTTMPDFGCSDCNCKTHLFFHDTNIISDILGAAGKLTGNESIIISPCM